MSKQPAPDPLSDSVQISWDDWPAFRIQHGLRVAEVVQLENAQTEIICHEAVSRSRPMQDLTPNSQPATAHKSKLGLLLYTMLCLAAGAPGVPQRRTLAGGLRIDLIVGLDGQTRLQLSREKVYPSETEMATALNAWPYPLEDLAPKKFDYRSRFYAQFAWPTPAPEKML